MLQINGMNLDLTDEAKETLHSFGQVIVDKTGAPIVAGESIGALATAEAEGHDRNDYIVVRLEALTGTEAWIRAEKEEHRQPIS